MEELSRFMGVMEEEIAGGFHETLAISLAHYCFAGGLRADARSLP
jgi:hypothetical protein